MRRGEIVWVVSLAICRLMAPEGIAVPRRNAGLHEWLLYRPGKSGAGARDHGGA